MKTWEIKGHILAFITVLIWGTTFVSTKVLLRDFLPIEILFFRFSLGLAALFVVYPKRLKGTTLKQEMFFAAAGLCGVTLYFLMENIALTYTTASNVGIIASLAPFAVAILAKWFLSGENPQKNFYIGFVISLIGILLININGSIVLALNPLGDILALSAVFVWAWYSIFTKKICAFGYNTIQTTRKIFFYGLLFMVPLLPIFGFQWRMELFFKHENILNIVFLGLGASALCFVTWNMAVSLLGAVRTSVYIYLVPVLTVAMASVFLNEPLTPMLITGTMFTLIGLVISEVKFKFFKSKDVIENNT